MTLLDAPRTRAQQVSAPNLTETTCKDQSQHLPSSPLAKALEQAVLRGAIPSALADKILGEVKRAEAAIGAFSAVPFDHVQRETTWVLNKHINRAQRFDSNGSTQLHVAEWDRCESALKAALRRIDLANNTRADADAWAMGKYGRTFAGLVERIGELIPDKYRAQEGRAAVSRFISEAARSLFDGTFDRESVLAEARRLKSAYYSGEGQKAASGSRPHLAPAPLIIADRAPAARSVTERLRSSTPAEVLKSVGKTAVKAPTVPEVKPQLVAPSASSRFFKTLTAGVTRMARATGGLAISFSQSAATMFRGMTSELSQPSPTVNPTRQSTDPVLVVKPAAIPVSSATQSNQKAPPESLASPSSTTAEPRISIPRRIGAAIKGLFAERPSIAKAPANSSLPTREASAATIPTPARIAAPTTAVTHDLRELIRSLYTDLSVAVSLDGRGLDSPAMLLRLSSDSRISLIAAIIPELVEALRLNPAASLIEIVIAKQQELNSALRESHPAFSDDSEVRTTRAQLTAAIGVLGAALERWETSRGSLLVRLFGESPASRERYEALRSHVANSQAALPSEEQVTQTIELLLPELQSSPAANTLGPIHELRNVSRLRDGRIAIGTYQPRTNAQMSMPRRSWLGRWWQSLSR